MTATKEQEFNLSDKIIYWRDKGFVPANSIHIEDVKEFIRRGKEKFIHLGKSRCNWCKDYEIDVYDVIGLAICEDCISRITRLSPSNRRRQRVSVHKNRKLRISNNKGLKKCNFQ